jgi:hypothetical protein
VRLCEAPLDAVSVPGAHQHRPRVERGFRLSAPSKGGERRGDQSPNSLSSAADFHCRAHPKGKRVVVSLGIKPRELRRAKRLVATRLHGSS